MIQNPRSFPVVGNPFAITDFMILVIIRMKVLSEKRVELSQAIASLTGSIRTEKGCNRCDFCQSMEDENRLFLLEEWDTEENLISYLKSGHFRILRGAMNLLKEPYKMIFHTVLHPAENGGDLMDKLISLAYDRSYGSHERPREICRIR
jgi:quinol monooxygenase YgiN